MLAAVVGASFLGACRGDAVACGRVEEPVESLADTVHLLPGHEIEYRHRPPVRGPHYAVDPEPGVRREALSEPEQVGALEAGTVILQYADDLDRADVRRLEAVGRSALEEGRRVIVMPAAGPIDGDRPVAFTAFRFRQRCTGVDAETARRFIDTYEGLALVHEGG